MTEASHNFWLFISKTDDKKCCPTCGAVLKNKGEVRVDLDIGIAIFDGVPVRLTGRCITILDCLASISPRTASLGFIMDSLYGLESEIDEPDQKVVSVFIYRLRKDMEKTNYKIETVWGKGYRLIRKEPEECAE